MNKQDTKHIVSYGGGVDSTAMIILLIKADKPIDYVVFADTGNEVPETYEFVKNYMEPYLKKHDIPFIVVYPYKKRSLWARCFKRNVFPDTHHRWCTRDVKITPIHKFYKRIGGYICEYIGITYEDTRRMKPSGTKGIEKLYPLVDYKIKRSGCIDIIVNELFPVPVKSGCFFCCWNSKERWDWLKKEHPNLYKLSKQLEQNSKHYPKRRLIKDENSGDSCDDGSCMT